ncbi:MAG: helix-turn-helix domain-containing protein [Candidatus Micrarchaeota archaeon]
MHQELLGRLREMGLNHYEAQAYLALSLHGVDTAGDIAEVGKIARPRVYDVLSKLQEKGFVALKSGRPAKYSALPLPEAMSTLKKRKQEQLKEELVRIDELGKLLQSKLHSGSGSKKYGIEENVWTLKGRDAIYSRIAEMLSNAKSHVVVNSTPEGILRKVNENLGHFEKAKGRGVKLHFVTDMGKFENRRTAFHSPNSHVSRLATQLLDKHVPTRMVLADDEAMIFLTPTGAPAEEEVGLWVKNPHLASTLKGILSPTQ